MGNLTALFAGLLFGFGLIISGMANPEKVLSFLDLVGTWDPSLALVMAGAIAVGLVGFTLAKGRTSTFSGTPMQLPTATQIDRRLLIGGVMFGVGWGLAGICPGPALVGLGSGIPQAFLFVAAMLSGMALYRFTAGR
ncbi:MAG: DUF6691 family protein [Azovibrio sp.]